MPEISRFFGIVIQMYPNEHAPAHFHARYGNHAASFELRTLQVTGDFPKRATRLVKDWARMHEPELLANWDAMRSGGEVRRIEPLE